MQTYNTRFESGLIFPLKQLPPIDAVEEMVRLDLTGTLCTQPLLGVAVQQPREEIARSWGDDVRAGEVQWFCKDFAVHLIRILIVEGWETCKHFVEEDAEGPPVDCFGVATASE